MQVGESTYVLRLPVTHSLGRVNERRREPHSVANVVATSSPFPIVRRLLAFAFHVAGAVGQIAGTSRWTDRQSTIMLAEIKLQTITY